MKTTTRLLTLWLISLFFSTGIFSQTSTLYLTTSGGNYQNEKWVDITTGANGTGTVIWAQGNGSYGDSQGLVTDQAFTVNDGQTYYINCYDLYDDTWDGSTYEVRDLMGGFGTLVCNNGGLSPDDGNDQDVGGIWEDMNIERESSEAFAYSPPACPLPSTPISSNITSSSAELSWTQTGSVINWDIELGVKGFTPTGTPTAFNVSNPYIYTNLSSGVEYEWYVRSDCGGGSYTNWVGPYSFLTPGSCGIWTVELYDSYGDGWDYALLKIYVNGVYINQGNGLSLSIGYGPLSYQFPTDVGDIISTEYIAGTYPSENSYKIYDENNQVVAWEGSPGIPGNVGDYTIPTGLTSCSSGTSCPIPSLQAVGSVLDVSAVLQWTENGTANLWDIEWGSAGFTPGSGSMIYSVNNKPYTLTGLSASTSYDWYVRSDCGSGTYSSWVGPYSFSTACTPESIPHSELFDGASLPSCWYKSGDPLIWEISSYYPEMGNYLYSEFSHNGIGSVHTPYFDGSTKSNLHIRFFTEWKASYPGGTQDGYLYGSTDGGITSHLIDEWHHESPDQISEWKEYDVSSWADGESHISFWWKMDKSNDMYWIIDYFGIKEGAFEPNGLWSGAISSDWHTRGNWADSIVPFPFTKVEINPGKANFPTLSSQGYYDDLLIRSNSLGDGSLIGQDKLFGGNIYVERYISYDQWHLIGSPIGGGLMENFTGKYVQTYDESTNSYTYQTNPNINLGFGIGYSIWNPSSTAPDSVVVFTESLNSFSPISLTRSGTGQSYGKNLVANPYLSAIDWDANSGWTKTNLNNAIYLYDGGAKNWKYYVNGTGVNGGTSIIPMGQGFFVIVKDDGSTSGVLEIGNETQVHSNQVFLKNENVNEVLKIGIHNVEYSDELCVRFDESSNYGFDSHKDAYKMYSSSTNTPQIYTVVGDLEYAINTTPFVESLQMNMEGNSTDLNYIIFMIENPDLSMVLLEDLYTGICTELTQKDYSFEYVEGIKDRFILHFSPLSVKDETKPKIDIYSTGKSIRIFIPENVSAHYTILNLLGEEVKRSNANSALNSVSLDKAGVYIVNVQSDKGIIRKKVVLK